MKHIQKLIPTAIDSIEQCHVLKDGSIDREFNGYISSFGASIISAGLLPSVIFYSQKGESESNRPKIIECIQFILHHHHLLDGLLVKKVYDLYKAPVSDKSEIARFTNSITDAAVALKLAIRTYPKTKKPQL